MASACHAQACIGEHCSPSPVINSLPTSSLPLPGYEVVLGTEWLATLSPILWDFEAFTMSFWHTNHPVCWFLRQDVSNFLDHYPTFQLEDELLLEGGRDVMGTPEAKHGQQPPRDLHGQQPPGDMQGQQEPEEAIFSN